MNRIEERIAVLRAHRACCGTEADPANGKLHGYCVVCGVPWPCAYAGDPPPVRTTLSFEPEDVARLIVRAVTEDEESDEDDVVEIGPARLHAIALRVVESEIERASTGPCLVRNASRPLDSLIEWVESRGGALSGESRDALVRLVQACAPVQPPREQARDLTLAEFAVLNVRERRRVKFGDARDDAETTCELADSAGNLAQGFDDPWGLRKKHAKCRRTQLVIAGALIIAEIDRLDRAAAPAVRT